MWHTKHNSKKFLPNFAYKSELIWKLSEKQFYMRICWHKYRSKQEQKKWANSTKEYLPRLSLPFNQNLVER